MRQHPVEAARQVGNLVAALDRCGRGDGERASLDRAHGVGELDDAPDEDAPEQDPEGRAQEEARPDRDGEERAALGGDEPFRFGERGHEQESCAGAAAVGERLQVAHGAALIGLLDDGGDARRRLRRSAPAGESDPARGDAGRDEVRIEAERGGPCELSAKQPPMHADGRRQLLGDLIVVGASAAEGGGRFPRELHGAIADFPLYRTLGNAQAETGRDEQRGREHRREERDELQPQRQEASAPLRAVPAGTAVPPFRAPRLDGGRELLGLLLLVDPGNALLEALDGLAKAGAELRELAGPEEQERQHQNHENLSKSKSHVMFPPLVVLHQHRV